MNRTPSLAARRLRCWLVFAPLVVVGCMGQAAPVSVPTKTELVPPPTAPKAKPVTTKVLRTPPRPATKPTLVPETPVLSEPFPTPTPAPVPEPEPEPEPKAEPEPSADEPDAPEVPGALAPRKNGEPLLGLNLNSVNDWSTEWPFVDVFHASRPWSPGKDAGIDFDPSGNPLLKSGQSVQTLCCREVQGHYPAGKYVTTWQGTGRVEIKKWDISKVVKEGKGRIEFEVKPGDGGIEVNVLESSPKDPVRNIQVFMPGMEKAKSRFHPLFLERLGPARVLRFMDWQATNNSPVTTWDQRAKPTDAQWSKAGVPIEVMCELANARKADPWFCVPHLADDEYVRQMARLVKEKLSADRKVYVEYSNEVWNWQFGQTKYAREQGLKRKLGDPDHARFYSERSVEIFKIWEKEFGGKERLVRVLASQAVVPWLSEQIITWKNAYKYADALSVAPYWGNDFGDPKNANETAGLTVDQLIERLAKEVDGSNRDHIRAQAALAKKFKLKLVAYEGGQHLCGYGGAENNESLTKLFQAANRHPKMYDLYRKHLKHWDEAGGGLYVLFANVARPTKWGSWGLLEYQDQPVEQAPKYRAFLDHAARK